MNAAETALIVANSTSGYEVGLERTFENLENSSISKAVVVNRMYNENADFNKVISSIEDNIDVVLAPVLIPIGKAEKFEGVVDVLAGKAYIDDKKTKIPESMTDEVEAAKEKLMEAVAETDDELTEKYLENLELEHEDLLNGFQNGVRDGKLFPVFSVSAAENIGIASLLWAINEYLPSPADKSEITMIDEEGEEKKIKASPDGDLVAYVYKSVTDPNLGDLAYVRILSGKIQSGKDVFVPEKDAKDKISSIYYTIGKKRTEAEDLKAGELGTLVKLKTARTLSTLVEPNMKLKYKAPELPSRVYWKAIKATNQKDEDKISSALYKLLDEDPTIHMDFNPEIKQTILSGIGDQQINLIQKKLKKRFKVEATLQNPRIAYKETITGNADVRYRHKKQSGGRGQYGEVYIKISPQERGEEFEFINSIVGGAIPSKFIPSVEKGLVETMEKGIVAGYPIVDLKVELYDGSFHDVDSSEMAFKIAASQALKKGFDQAGPILLEPIHKIKIIIPMEYMGDVMGDISTRRGKIQGSAQENKKQILNAQIPLAELYNYYPALKSLTQGRGHFEQEFSHFEKVPNDIAKKEIEKFKNNDE